MAAYFTQSRKEAKHAMFDSFEFIQLQRQRTEKQGHLYK